MNAQMQLSRQNTRSDRLNRCPLLSSKPTSRPRAATTKPCAASSRRSASTIATSLRWRRWPRMSARRRPRLQKLFTRWAGLSPKAFLQAVTLDHARKLLDQGMPLLETSFEVGMSGPGRLHDLFVTHEAMSPGDYKTRGDGLTIRYGYHISPFGVALIMVTDRGLAGLSFNDPGRRARGLRRHVGPLAERHLCRGHGSHAALCGAHLRSQPAGAPTSRCASC